MTRPLAAVASGLFFIVAPGTVVGFLPWWISRWQMRPVLLPVRIAGALVLCAGLVVLVDSFVRFVVQGVGTPAPVAPTRHLVVTGLYRYVRNPMYAAVLAAVIGQAMLFGSTALLVYALGVWLACHVFVVMYEEPKLHATFGPEYKQYRAAVPRWIPRRWR